MTSTIRKIDPATVELVVELSASDLASYITIAEERLAKNVKVDGFRAGKVPKDVIRKHIGEQQIREEGLQIAVEQSMSEAIAKEKLDVIEQSKFVIKENKPDKLLYQVELALYPTIELGMYKGIAITKKPITVTDEELQKVLTDIAESRATGEGDKKVVPELTDAFVQTLGNFTSLQNLKEVVKEGLVAEKEDREHQRRRLDMLNAILSTTKLTVPERMVEQHIDSMMRNFELDLQAQGMELPLYLAHLKKTQDDLRKDWRPQAEQQVKMMLVLHEVAQKEDIKISDEELQEVLEMRLQQYLAGRPGMSPEEMKQINVEQVKHRLYSELLNKKVFEFLESHATLS